MENSEINSYEPTFVASWKKHEAKSMTNGGLISCSSLPHSSNFALNNRILSVCRIIYISNYSQYFSNDKNLQKLTCINKINFKIMKALNETMLFILISSPIVTNTRSVTTDLCSFRTLNSIDHSSDINYY